MATVGGYRTGLTRRSFELAWSTEKQVQARYEDFGPTSACEHLASDDGLAVHAETLRRWLRGAGCGKGSGAVETRIASGGKPRRILAS